jgi:hypothetical protein
MVMGEKPNTELADDGAPYYQKKKKKEEEESAYAKFASNNLSVYLDNDSLFLLYLNIDN